MPAVVRYKVHIAYYRFNVDVNLQFGNPEPGPSNICEDVCGRYGLRGRDDDRYLGRLALF